MDAAEAAIRHEHNDVAVAMFIDDGADDVVYRGNISGSLLPGTKVVDELFGGQALRFRQR